VGRDPVLAFQVAQYRMERGHFNDVHMAPPGTAEQGARVHGLPGAGRQHLDGTMRTRQLAGIA
jgi:hypothetical protein